MTHDANLQQILNTKEHLVSFYVKWDNFLKYLDNIIKVHEMDEDYEVCQTAKNLKDRVIKERNSSPTNKSIKFYFLDTYYTISLQ